MFRSGHILKEPTSPRNVTSKQHSRAFVDAGHCTVNMFIHNNQPIITLLSRLHLESF